MTVSTGTGELVIARAISGDLFIIDASDNIASALDGSYLEDNSVTNSEVIPLEKGIYGCECSVFCDDGDRGFYERSDCDFYITILDVKQVLKL